MKSKVEIFRVHPYRDLVEDPEGFPETFEATINRVLSAWLETKGDITVTSVTPFVREAGPDPITYLMIFYTSDV